MDHRHVMHQQNHHVNQPNHHVSQPNHHVMAPAGQLSPQEQAARKSADLETLRHIIAQWNANRLDLFELSFPNEVRVLFK